jgi:hypothetical protein
VLCYRNEYDAQTTPVLAIYQEDNNDYVRFQCHTLGIELVEIERKSSGVGLINIRRREIRLGDRRTDGNRFPS